MSYGSFVLFLWKCLQYMCCLHENTPKPNPPKVPYRPQDKVGTHRDLKLASSHCKCLLPLRSRPRMPSVSARRDISGLGTFPTKSHPGPQPPPHQHPCLVENKAGLHVGEPETPQQWHVLSPRGGNWEGRGEREVSSP